MPLGKDVIHTDLHLEAMADRSRTKLAEHRWHWTLDESNPDRVSIREYARAIGRDQSRITRLVNAYQAWRDDRTSISFEEHVARQYLTGDTLVAAEAVAEARGISLDNARTNHREEVRAVKAVAQERAERRETTVEEEAPRVAQRREQVRQAEKKTKDDRRAAHDRRYLQIEGQIATAMRYLRTVLADSEGVDFTAEERDLLAGTIGRLRALLNLIDVRIVGTADIDWDAEMAKMTAGEAS